MKRLFEIDLKDYKETDSVFRRPSARAVIIRDDKMGLVLIRPSKDIEDDAVKYKEEHFDYGEEQVHGSSGLAFYDDYDKWLDRVTLIGEGNPENGVRTSTFFSKRLSDGKLIGCIKIHHSLTDDLKNGGHIAYGIRPSERGKGYGKEQLQLCLEYL